MRAYRVQILAGLFAGIAVFAVGAAFNASTMLEICLGCAASGAAMTYASRRTHDLTGDARWPWAKPHRHQ